MGQAKPPRPVKLILAMTSQSDKALDWALAKAESSWGDIWAKGPRFDFDHTRFYHPTMGNQLIKQLVSFATLIDPGDLAELKLQTNQWEAEYAESSSLDCERPLNLDPGYLTEAKLVLATVKNRDHRIYLSDGIYAEVTLAYHGKQWNGSRWTYPDYLTDFNLEFLTRCRDHLRSQLHNSAN